MNLITSRDNNCTIWSYFSSCSKRDSEKFSQPILQCLNSVIYMDDSSLLAALGIGSYRAALYFIGLLMLILKLCCF